MSYVENHLSRNEEIVYRSRQHWFSVIARCGIWIVVAVLAVALLLWIGTNGPVLGNDALDGILTVIALAGLLGALAYVGFVYWDWRNQEWIITTQRVIRAEGVLNKSVSDSNLEKINDARLDQSMFGRMFGFGTLDILTAAEEAGGTNLADFPMIAEPMPPRAGSDRVAVSPEGSAAAEPVAPAVTPPADELTAKLESLAGLRDKGLITPEEYEAKKRDLLERI